MKLNNATNSRKWNFYLSLIIDKVKMDHRKLCFCSEGRVAASQFITEIVLSVLGRLTHHPDEALCRLGKSPLNADHCTTTYSGLVLHPGLYSGFMFAQLFCSVLTVVARNDLLKLCYICCNIYYLTVYMYALIKKQ